MRDFPLVAHYTLWLDYRGNSLAPIKASSTARAA